MRSPPTLLLCVLALGCGPKPHPLQASRAGLAELDAPPPEGWAPEAAVRVGAPALEVLTTAVEAELQRAVPERMDVPLPLIGALSVAPNAEAPQVSVAPVEGCRSCVLVQGDWSGRLVILGQEGRGEGFPWRARTENTFALGLGEAEGAQVVQVEAVRDRTQRAEVAFEGLAGLTGRAVNGAIGRQLKRELDEGALSKPMEVAKLPPSEPAWLRDLRLVQGEDGAWTAEIAVTGLSHGEVGPLPDAEDGWVAAIAAESALGAAQVFAARTPMVGRYAFDPLFLRFDAMGPVGEVRVWKSRRNGAHRSRDFAFATTLQVDEDGLISLSIDDLRPLPGGAGLGRVRRVLDRRLEGQRWTVETARRVEIRETAVLTRVVRLSPEGGRLVVYGDIAVEDVVDGE
jgi:hypothetical protein